MGRFAGRADGPWRPVRINRSRREASKAVETWSSTVTSPSRCGTTSGSSGRGQPVAVLRVGSGWPHAARRRLTGESRWAEAVAHRTGGKSRQRASASHCGHFAVEGLAEFERSLIMSRTQAGVQRAKERGVAFGRPAKLSAKQRQLIAKRYADGETAAALARDFDVGVATVWRALNSARP